MLQTLTGIVDPYPVSLESAAESLLVAPADPDVARDGVMMCLLTPETVVYVHTLDTVDEDEHTTILLPLRWTPVESLEGQLFGRAYWFGAADPTAAVVLVWPVRASDPTYRSLTSLYTQYYTGADVYCNDGYRLRVSGLVAGAVYSVALTNAAHLQVPVGDQIITGYTELYARRGRTTVGWCSLSTVREGLSGQRLQMELGTGDESLPYGDHDLELMATIGGNAVSLARVLLEVR